MTVHAGGIAYKSARREDSPEIGRTFQSRSWTMRCIDRTATATESGKAELGGGTDPSGTQRGWKAECI